MSESTEWLGLASKAAGMMGSESGIAFGTEQGLKEMRRAQARIDSVFLYLKKYFSVSQSYVFFKLLMLVCPLFCLSKPEIDLSDDSVKMKRRAQVQECDLYLPLMALMTHILLYCLTQGSVGAFHPSMLSSRATLTGIIIFIESLLLQGATHFTGVKQSIMPDFSFLDCVSLASYKFVGIAIAQFIYFTVLSALPYWLIYIVLAYFGGCAAYVIHESLSGMSDQNKEHENVFANQPLDQEPKPRDSIQSKHLLICRAYSACQLPLSFLLCVGVFLNSNPPESY